MYVTGSTDTNSGGGRACTTRAAQARTNGHTHVGMTAGICTNEQGRHEHERGRPSTNDQMHERGCGIEVGKNKQEAGAHEDEDDDR